MDTGHIICISCPKGCRIKIKGKDDEIKFITGYDCIQGKEYALKEYKNPTRILPTTVKVGNGELPLVPVKTKQPIAKDIIFKAMKETAKITVEAPIRIGDIIISNLLNTGVDIVATRNIEKSQNNISGFANTRHGNRYV